MSVIKYRTSRSSITIEQVECEKETAKCVWVRREHLFGGSSSLDKWSKVTDWHIYHDTWEGAKEYLLKRTLALVESLRYQLKNAERDLKKLKALSK